MATNNVVLLLKLRFKALIGNQVVHVDVKGHKTFIYLFIYLHQNNYF